MAGRVPIAAEAEHVGRYPADFRIVDHSVPGYGSQLVWLQRFDALAEGRCRYAFAGQPIYVMLYASAIFFCFFYTALVFNSKETADNLKKSGAFVPGIRPGEQTARYIDKILMR
jgi:preprotein translocase subunit SecY